LQKEYEAHYWTLPPKLALVHYATRHFQSKTSSSRCSMNPAAFSLRC
jgi:hypothetical protein